MNSITIAQAAKLCGGRLCGNAAGDEKLGKVVIDSRAVTAGDFFVAYKGERVDGHDYIGAAFDKGAVCCLAERVPEGESRAVIVVSDVQAALEKIAAAYRRTLNIPVIGITGSVGKTSAKEMISAVLEKKFNVLKTDKNLNNQIGVPMTISRIEPKHEAAVIEMGISGFGEMSVLAEMAMPDIAVFTVIGHAHLEFLHDLEGVLSAKTEMLDIMDASALAIVNGDDELLRAFKCRQKKLCFGLGEHNDVRAHELSTLPDGSTECSISYGEHSIHVVIPAYGRHMIYAALAGAAVGFALGMDDADIVSGIAAYETVGRRAAVTDTGSIVLVDDCYNANPDSVKCGVDSMASMSGRHVCILGDMLELGEGEEEMHRSVGEYAAAKGADLVLCSGPLALKIAAGAGEKGRHFATREELIAALPELINKGDCVLVKASRSMKFEEISEALKGLKL